MALPSIHCHPLQNDGYCNPEHLQQTRALFEHLLLVASCQVLEVEMEDRPGGACFQSRGANWTCIKPNGGFGLWDMMNPSQGAINLEQSGEVQIQVPEELRNKKGVSENVMAQPRLGVGPGPAILTGKCTLGSNLNPSCCKKIPFSPVLLSQQQIL